MQSNTVMLQSRKGSNLLGSSKHWSWTASHVPVDMQVQYDCNILSVMSVHNHDDIVLPKIADFVEQALFQLISNYSSIALLQ